jgi:transcriptional regulator with XRE-family HTH domain
MSRTAKTLAMQLRGNLAALREQRGLTQVELGTRAGIASASVSHFETGQRTPTLATLVKLADALGTSLDALVGRESSKLGMKVDPIFVRASNSDSKTLEAVKRVTAALLEQMNPSQGR